MAEDALALKVSNESAGPRGETLMPPPPSLYCRVMADAKSNSGLDEEIVEILRCPVTGSRLRLESGWLVGETGGLRYPIREGIPVLLAEEAKLPPGFDSLDAFRARFGKTAQ